MNEILLIAALSSLGADYLQTKQILDSNGRYLESNPIINKSNVDSYFLAAATITTGIYLIKDKDAQLFKKCTLFGIAAMQTSIVVGNINLGVSISF